MLSVFCLLLSRIRGSTDRIIPAQIDVMGDTKGLVAGINASVKVETATAQDELFIPLEALIDNGDDTYQCYIEDEIAEEYIKKQFTAGYTIKVDLEDGKVVLSK